jgi:hypothetical protein
MPIEFRCSQCTQLLRVPETAAGKSARCPKCQALMTVPSATAIVQSSGETPPPADAFPPASPPEFGSAPPAVPPPADPFPNLQPLSPKPASDNPFAGVGGPPEKGPADPMNPYASPAAAAYAYVPQYPGGPRPGLPWETQPKSFGTWWETTKLCLMQPSYAYRIMWQYGGLGSPLLHGLCGLVIGTFGQLLWTIPLVVVAFVAGNRGQGGPEAAGMIGLQVGMQIGQALFWLAVAVALLFIGSAITHVCLMLLGGAKQGYETTFRVVSYSNGSTAWMNAIPCGAFVLGIWTLVLNIIGLAEAHEIPASKAALAVFLPLIVCLGVCGITALALFGVGAFSRIFN